MTVGAVEGSALGVGDALGAGISVVSLGETASSGVFSSAGMVTSSPILVPFCSGASALFTPQCATTVSIVSLSGISLKLNVVPGTICSVVSVCVVSPVSVSTQNPVLAVPSAVSETVYSVLAESAKPPFSMETGVSPCVTCAVALYCAPLMEDVPAETPTVNHAHESPQRHTRQSAAHKIGGSSIARSVSLRSRSAFERRGGLFLFRSVFFIWKLPSVETGSAGDGKWLTTGDSETIKRHGVHAP